MAHAYLLWSIREYLRKWKALLTSAEKFTILPIQLPKYSLKPTNKFNQQRKISWVIWVLTYKSSPNITHLIPYHVFMQGGKWHHRTTGKSSIGSPYGKNGLVERGLSESKMLCGYAWVSNSPYNFTAACLTQVWHSCTVCANGILSDTFGAYFWGRPGTVSSTYEAACFGVKTEFSHVNGQRATHASDHRKGAGRFICKYRRAVQPKEWG